MKCVPATVECVHSASKYGFPCTKEMMLLETSRRALSCCAQSDLIAGAPADLCRGHPTVCSDLPGEHTPLGCWSGDCHWVPLQVLRPPTGLSEDSLVPSGSSSCPLPPWPVSALLYVLIRAAQLTAAQPPSSLGLLAVLPCGVSPCWELEHKLPHHAGFGSLRLMGVPSAFMWVCVCTYVYITEVSVRNALW